MNLNQELHLRTRHLAPTDVLGAMGYVSPAGPAVSHYLAVGESPYLGLEREYRDARFGERGFLETLCRCAGLAEAEYLPAIEELARRLAEDRAAYRHWLFADTDYVRGPGTPIFAMAFTEKFRRLRFPLGFWRLPYEERLAAACQKAREHMQETEGRLVTWGRIQRYHYFHGEAQSVVISPRGEVLGERSGFTPPRATFGLAGSSRPLDDLFGDGDA